MADVLDDTQCPDVDEEWYVRSFGDLYPLIYQHRDDESARREVAAALALLHLPPQSRVLDVACGGGRHLAALLESRMSAVGVDLSEPQLHRAIQRPGLAGRLVRADIRKLPFVSAFDAALNLFTSFGYFSDERENHQALASMVRTLRPGGWLLMDLAHRPHVEASHEPRSRCERGGYVIERRRRVTGSRVISDTTVTSPQGQVVRLHENVRLYDRAELSAMLTAAGLTDLRWCGSLEGEELRDDSPRLIAMGRRA